MAKYYISKKGLIIDGCGIRAENPKPISKKLLESLKKWIKVHTKREKNETR